MFANELFKHHIKCCTGDVCELALNKQLVTKLGELCESFAEKLNTIPDVKTPLELFRVVKVFNATYSMFVKNLLQDCKDRPLEYTDVRFIQYMATQASKVSDLANQIDAIITANPEIVAKPKAKKGK